MKKFSVIVAGGIGSRMRTAIPKQYLTLKGKPVLWYTLSTFLQAYDDMSIILVAAADQVGKASEIAGMMNQPERIIMAQGGETRFQSVKNGLQYVEMQSVVFIHDAVRCLVSADLIVRCYENAMKYGTAIPAIEASDSIRIGSPEDNEVYDRRKVNIIQTPQTFKSEILFKAYEQEFEEGFTDDATVVEKSGTRIHLVEGEASNIKITRPIDLVIAEKLLEGKVFDQ